MKMKAYESDPLPIKFREDQILMYSGNTDQMYFAPLSTLYLSGASKSLIEKVIKMRLKNNKVGGTKAILSFNSMIAQILPNVTVKNPVNTAEFEKIKGSLLSDDTTDLGNNINQKYDGLIALLKGGQKGDLVIPESSSAELGKILTDFEKPWMSCDLTEAMAFVRDDANFITEQGGGKTSFFPTSKFILKVNKKNAIAAGTLKTSIEKDSCPQNIEFEFNTEKDKYLTREEIMMLDIVANNDWKRGIYFSSNRGSSVAIALLSSGYIKQVGMAYELSPVRQEPTFYNLDKMYKNLTQTYHYGKMNAKGILTDYYARRHTIQYRVNFLLLAEQFLNIGNKKRAVELLDFSLAKMPMENVIDVGEVNGFDRMSSLTINAPHQSFEYTKPNGQVDEIQPMCSGTLHEYVQLYYLAGDKKKAEKLGLKLMGNYESIINYYAHTNARIAAKEDNVEDLFATLDACFKIKSTIDKSGALALRLNQVVNSIYKKTIPKLMNELNQLSSNNNESAYGETGLYVRLNNNLVKNSTAIGEHYGYLPKKKAALKAPAINDIKGLNIPLDKNKK